MDQIFAVVAGGVVTRICELPTGMDVSEVYGNADYIAAPRGVEVGSTYDGSAFGPKAPPAPEPVLAITYKADLYRRCTDAEAEAIEVALAAAPVRERRLFESAQYLDHTAPEFASLRDHLTGMFGKTRAAELLAAS